MYHSSAGVLESINGRAAELSEGQRPTAKHLVAV